MIFKNTSILTENMERRDHVNVRTEGAFITEISDFNNSEIDCQSEERVIDGSKLLLMPGFYNAHAHSTMALMRGYSENMTLQDWLFNSVFPFEDKLTHEAVYYGTLLSMAESLKHGIVSTSDMYYFTDDMVKAYVDAGTKGNISRAVANPTGEDFKTLKSARETIDAVKKYNGINNGKVIIDASLHAEYTSDENTARGLAELTKELGVIMHVHASETKLEHEECKERHEGRTPIKYFYDCGLFDVPALAAHCVWAEEEDMDIMVEKGVTAVTNPISNLKLASGICDIKKMMDKGVKLAIGTDSVASNNNLSIFEEMKTASLLAKYFNNDPRVVSAKDVLMMATRTAALAQGREDCGIIKEGYRADMIALNLDAPNMMPVYDIASNIVLSATDSDIVMTIVDGEVLFEKGEFKTIDLEKTKRGTEEAIKDILSRL